MRLINHYEGITEFEFFSWEQVALWRWKIESGFRCPWRRTKLHLEKMQLKMLGKECKLVQRIFRQSILLVEQICTFSSYLSLPWVFNSIIANAVNGLEIEPRLNGELIDILVLRAGWTKPSAFWYKTLPSRAKRKVPLTFSLYFPIVETFRC